MVSTFYQHNNTINMKIRSLYILAFSILLIITSCKSDAKQKVDISSSTPTQVEKASVVEENILPKEEPAKQESKDKVEPIKKEATSIKQKALPKPKTVITKAERVVVDKKKETKVKGSTKIKEKKVSSSETPIKNPVVKKDKESIEVIKPAPVVEEKSTPKPEKPIETKKPEKPIQYEVPIGFPNHKVFNGFLNRYVSNAGVVDYSGMKKNPADLDKYLTSLENTKFTSTWKRDQKLAFWINAYNAYTIKLILDNYPVKKITDLHGGKPWDKKWIKLNGKTLSLNNIENDIIRPEFNEPRIHFAVNCAAKSCPPILNAAFTASKLDAQLESQTKKFVNNSTHNSLSKNEITLSKIFDWYGSDFGNVAAFVAKYANTTVKPTAKVKFNEYDWALNGE